MTGAEPSENRYTGAVAALLTHGEPKKSAGQRSWPDYTNLGLNQHDAVQLIQMTRDPELNQAPGDSLKVWAPLHAWRALGQLGATEAVEPLLALFEELGHDDWARQELPDVLGMLGPSILPILEAYLADDSKEVLARVGAIEAVERLGNRHPGAKERCTEVIVGQLRKHDLQAPELNGFLINSMIDLGAVKEIDLIREAFSDGDVDPLTVGDVEEVEIELGLRAERSTAQLSSWFTESLEMQSRAPRTESRTNRKVGRNEPCPCGSGKKYKKCCGG